MINKPSLVAFSFAVVGIANSQGMHERKPPPAAFSACAGKSINTSCDMRTPRGSMNGTCQKPRGLDKVVCIPEHRNSGHNTNNQHHYYQFNKSKSFCYSHSSLLA